ncbi:DUF4350 domain-containing protein [Pseudomonas sp. UL073]|uniref:DUF4350 domain-containing protein n=1 Tax=Zestomonas insulae TaxID=2809017 RepID=A0ABS2IID9_9GAMM|nr:DUF4350 domain-containing protein [Pseudomonas insulae]MBM7061700.1 DUF4350 domain-containing protein [Pseudomonas insulae]
MSRRAQFYLGAGLLLAVGLLAIYALGRLTPYQEELKHGASPEARSNPYLAAEQFLRQRGIRVQRADGLPAVAALPSAGQTLLLLGDRGNMTPRQAEQLLDWASKGGHLLVVAERLWDEKEGKSGDLLLDHLGVQQFLSEDLDEDDKGHASQPPADAAKADSDAAPAAEDEPSEDADRYPQLTKLYLENDAAPAYIDFDTDYHLYDSKNLAHAWANSGDSTHLLQLYYGNGLVSVLSDPWIWQNTHIAKYDNAWLLWYLTQDSAVTLLYRADRDSLLSLLRQYFPEALAALALLVALLLWHVGRRRGPLLAPLSRARRQLEEHLRGSADFQLRHGGQQSLIQALQRDIQRRARRRHAGFERLDVASQWQVLGRLTRLPSSAVSQAMRPLPAQRLSAPDFTRQVAHLQTLRNAL